MEKNDFVPGIYGTSLPLGRFTHQTQHNCGLDSDGSAENKLNSPGDKVVTGGVLGSTFYKDHYKAAVEQLAALSLSKNTRTAQLNTNSSKQGAFHSWSYIHHQGKNSVSREFSKPFAERPSNSSDTPVSLINTNPALAAFDGDFHNFGSCVQETDISKWTCHHYHNKCNSGPISPLRSKHLRASCNKCTKAPVMLDSSNMAARRSLSCSGNSAKIRPAVKMPSPNTPAVFSLPDSESSKCKLPRTRRKSCRNNVSLTGKPFNSHRLKSLSVLAKPKYSQVDHQ